MTREAQTGRSLFDVLVEAGIVRQGDQVRRVIIDIPHNDAVKLYVERLADERVFDVVQSLAGLEIRER